jgi:hypothetical protein
VPFSSPWSTAVLIAAPAPSTPLGPFQDSAVTGAAWITLMGFVGVVSLALFAAGPAAARVGADTSARVIRRLARAAVLLAVLALPAVLTDLAHTASESDGYD